MIGNFIYWMQLQPYESSIKSISLLLNHIIYIKLLSIYIWIFQIIHVYWYSCRVWSVSQWSVKTFISHFLCRLIKDHSKVARWIERKYSSATWNLLCYFPQKLLNKNLLKLRLKTRSSGSGLVAAEVFRVSAVLKSALAWSLGEMKPLSFQTSASHLTSRTKIT